MTITIEVQQRASSRADNSKIRDSALRLVQLNSGDVVAPFGMHFRADAASVTTDPCVDDPEAFLRQHCERFSLETPGGRVIEKDDSTPVKVVVFRASSEPPAEELMFNGDDESDVAVAARVWNLPHVDFAGQWDALVFQQGKSLGNLKYSVRSFCESSLWFSSQQIDSSIVQCHKLVLLHGPPGTGKTSLCRAVAQKIAISQQFFERSQFLEVNAHALFSKWFSESGKLLQRLFARIGELATLEPDVLLFVTVDEIESISHTRGSGAGEPADAMRAVNALLTELDTLRRHPNVFVLCTSNVTKAIDSAFVDRCDARFLVPLPGAMARAEIIRSCFAELSRCDLIENKEPLVRIPRDLADALVLHASLDSSSVDADKKKDVRLHRVWHAYAKSPAPGAAWQASQVAQLALKTEGFSGRALRKLPLRAHALSKQHSHHSDAPVQSNLLAEKWSVGAFFLAMHAAVEHELLSRTNF